MDNPFLIGSKVYLRPLEAQDARTLVRWMNDADVTRTLGIYRPMTEENEREFIERASKSPDRSRSASWRAATTASSAPRGS